MSSECLGDAAAFAVIFVPQFGQCLKVSLGESTLHFGQVSIPYYPFLFFAFSGLSVSGFTKAPASNKRSFGAE